MGSAENTFIKSKERSLLSLWYLWCKHLINVYWGSTVGRSSSSHNHFLLYRITHSSFIWMIQVHLDLLAKLIETSQQKYCRTDGIGRARGAKAPSMFLVLIEAKLLICKWPLWEAVLWWLSGLRHSYLAELFLQVTVMVWTMMKPKFVNYYYSKNFNLWQNNKTNK